MSELTKEDLEKIVETLRGGGWLCRTGDYDPETRLTDTIDGDAVANAFSELLALRTLRDAGDEEVEKWHKKIKDAIQIDYFDSDWDNAPTVLIDKLRDIVITRGQQLREAREEIERLKGCLKKSNDGFEEHERLWYLEQNKTETLTAELAALKSAPAMAEVDAAKRDCIDLLAKIVLARGIEEESKPPQPNPVPSYQELRERIDKLAGLARRSISSREEVVGMLDQMESDIRDVFSDDWCLLDELKNLSRCDTLQPYAAAHRLLAIACCPEIVEGK